MASLARNAVTVIDRFTQLASSSETSGLQAIDCCGDELTYAQIFIIVQGIAQELLDKFGQRPTVAIVCENTPYTLATILATWLIGGVAAPLDVHAPEALLKGMLNGVKPTCVVLPDSAAGNIKLIEDSGFTTYPFEASASGIPNLLNKYSRISASKKALPSLPTPEDDAVFIYTSSASSVANLKCVPVNHGTLLYNAALELATWRVRRGITKTLDEPAPLEKFRTLGWGPFSHIMAVAHDLTCHTILPAGCYIFGVPPSTYPISSKGIKEGVERPAMGQAIDVGALLLKTARRAKADLISGVPWLYKRMMEVCAREPKYVEMLKQCKQLLAGGALVDPEVQRWADENGFSMDVSIGMTEIGGALFEVATSTVAEGGYPVDQALVVDAKLELLDDDGKESDSYGELVISSKYISKGYKNFTSTVHHTNDEGVTSFRTGDMYKLINGRLDWQGRRDDYIQLGSAELLDPRIPEAELLKNPSIGRAALVGNNFMRGAADFICAIVELPSTGFRPQDVLQAFAAVNKDLHPPLRVPVSRVLILNEGEKLPINKKGLVWRKALEEKFGDRLHALLENPKLSRFSQFKEGRKSKASVRSYEELETEVSELIADALSLSRELLEDNRGSSFAELGMDSNTATRIVSKVNMQFGLDFPMSACHDYVDLEQLSRAIFEKLNQASSELSTGQYIRNISTSDDDVVIVGQAFRLPGQVNDENTFWDALMEKRQVLEHMGSDRWDHASFYYPPTDPPTKPPPGMINFTQMGRIEVAKYDNAFFGISPAEAYFVTPGSRVAMEVAVEALEDANIPLSKVKGSNMAVFVAQGPEFGYPDLIYTEKGFEVYDRYYGTGVADSAISGRLSYFLDIHGPSVTLNTACSGGLVALDNALSAIRYGQCEAAIVSSVNVHVWPGNFGFLSANQMSSLHGRCATFSAEADGYVPSEGAVAFIVKSKRAALRDGDNILGTVKSTSVQHNGRSQGLVAPNSKAQVALQRTVLASAGFQPKDIDFVENHGTGTILGDMMEIQAINEVFGGSHSSEAPLVLGAAKTVFGHTESSAGLVGVAKALQTLRHGVVPGLAHLTGDNLSPRLDTTVTPLRISHLPTTLPKRENNLPLRALSLSFGFAGTIAAVVLEEYKHAEITAPTSPPMHSSARSLPCLFVVSAKTEKALQEYLRRYIEFCEHAQDSHLPSICYTASIGREHYRFRFACACTSVKDLVTQLKDAIANMSFKAIPSKPRIAFAFAGQGSQWQGMGRALSDIDKVFAAYLMDYTAKASSLLGIDLGPLLFEVPDGSKEKGIINETHISQSCIFVFQCAMLKWLEHVGIRPNGTISHSLGEIAAAVATDAMDFDTALDFVIIRSNAMRPENTNGGLMAAIRAPVDLIVKRIAALGLSKSVVIAAYNASTQHVVSGDEDAVRLLIDNLAKDSIKGTVLSVNQGFHSHCIEKALAPIFDHMKHESDNISRPRLPHYSSVKGRALKGEERQDADYWVRQARQPVRFADAAKAIVEEGNFNAIIDLGPQNVIAHLLKDIAGSSTKPLALLPVCDRPTTNTLNPLIQAFASLFMLGITPDFEHMYSSRRYQSSKVAIPTYPWQRQRHYPDIIPSRTTKIKGQEMRSYSRRWRIGAELGSLLQDDHTLDGVPIVPAAALAMFVSLEAQKACSGTVSVSVKYLKPLMLADLSNDELDINIEDDKFICTHFRGDSKLGTICSGSLKIVGGQPKKTSLRILPDETINKAATYEKFADNLVRFGPRFQCIESIDRFEKASARIEVLSSGNTQHDFVRKMDAIMHMFGAIAPESPPELQKSGSFLPSAVNNLTLYSTSLPEKLICEYRLPIKVAAGSKKMTAEFKVFSESGELLAACGEYVVSWIPSPTSAVRPTAQSASPKESGTAPIPVSKVTKPTAQSPSQPNAMVSNQSAQNFIAECLKKILGLSETDMENIDASIPVLSLGIDSISFTQLRSDVLEKYEVDLPMTFLGEDALSLGDYAEFIVSSAKKTGTDASSDSGSNGESKSVTETLVSPAGVSPKDAERFISKSLQDVLGMTSEDMHNFDSSTPVLSLGIDSISFTQLRADVLNEYKVDIPMTFLGEDALTLGELAEFTVEKSREAAAA